MKRIFFTVIIALISCSISFSHESSSMSTPNNGSIESSTAPYFGYGDNKDGYIHKGRITLYRVGSGQGDTFDLYVKSATRYVKYKGRYYKIDGCQFVTINNIKYKTR